MKYALLDEIRCSCRSSALDVEPGETIREAFEVGTAVRCPQFCGLRQRPVLGEKSCPRSASNVTSRLPGLSISHKVWPPRSVEFAHKPGVRLNRPSSVECLSEKAFGKRSERFVS